MPNSAPVSVHLLPSLIPPGTLAGGIAVVIDVLRATTVMVHALNAGCQAIVPCLEIDEAKRVAASLPRQSALLGGERQGLPIPGFDLGNSPESYTPEICGGRTLVMTTTNGTRAILACTEADRVLIAAFANLDATARFLRDQETRPVHLVCAGTEGWISHEDTLLAGAIVASLAPDQEIEVPIANDEARIAVSHWNEAARRIETGVSLESILAEGRGGRRVREIGLAPDIVAAASRGTIGLIAELHRDPFRILAVQS